MNCDLFARVKEWHIQGRETNVYICVSVSKEDEVTKHKVKFRKLKRNYYLLQS